MSELGYLVCKKCDKLKEELSAQGLRVLSRSGEAWQTRWYLFISRESEIDGKKFQEWIRDHAAHRSLTFIPKEK